MGVASSPGPDRHYPGRRPIRSTFAIMVAVPVVCLVALWGVAVGLTPAGAVVRHGLFSPSHPGLTDVAVFAGGAVVVVLLAALLMGSFARRVSRDISALEVSARHLADEQLPQVMKNVRDQGEAAEADKSFTRPRTKTAEIARTAAAIDRLQRTAIAAAEHEATMRNGIGQVFVSLARRNQSLLQKQLRLIDTLEQKAADPAALADLFGLDHLTTRMRRHAENLIILSGEPPGRSWSDPVPVIDVLRGAVAEVEDYQRIRVVTRAQDAVTGSAVADMIHLLAELIENAALFSPSGTRVEVRAERVANGFAVEVEDRGLGIQPHQLDDINQQLLDPADFALADPDRLGLFVVGKLGARHGVRVALKPSPYGGITAVALMPHNVVVPAPETGVSGAYDTHRVAGRIAGLNRQSGDPLILTGRHAGLPSRAEDQADDAADPPAPALASTTLASTGLASTGTPAGRVSSLSPASPPGEDTFPEPDSSVDRGSPFSAASPRSPFTSASPPGEDTFPEPDSSVDRSGDRGSPFSAASPRSPFTSASPFSTPSPDTPRSPASTSGSPAVGSQAAATYRGLPRRVRQASLSQHLRNNPAPGAPVPPDAYPPQPSGDRAPEKARDFVASFRTGWQRDAEDDAPQTPPEAAGRQDSEAPPGEDT